MTSRRKVFVFVSQSVHFRWYSCLDVVKAVINSLQGARRLNVWIFPVHVLNVVIGIRHVTPFTDGIHLPGDLQETILFLDKVSGDRRSIIEGDYQRAFSVSILLKCILHIRDTPS